MNTSNEDFGAGKGERNEMSFSVTVISYCQTQSNIIYHRNINNIYSIAILVGWIVSFRI